MSQSKAYSITVPLVATALSTLCADLPTHRMILSTLKTNAGTVYVGDANEQPHELDALDSMTYYGLLSSTFVRGSVAGQTLAVSAFWS